MFLIRRSISPTNSSQQGSPLLFMIIYYYYLIIYIHVICRKNNVTPFRRVETLKNSFLKRSSEFQGNISVFRDYVTPIVLCPPPPIFFRLCYWKIRRISQWNALWDSAKLARCHGFRLARSTPSVYIRGGGVEVGMPAVRGVIRTRDVGWFASRPLVRTQQYARVT